MRRILLLMTTLHTLCAVCGGDTVRAADRPHIVVFLADDLGIDFVGCYGNRVIQTPHFDHLAVEGMKFTRMFAGSPTCSPSRAVIYSGLYPARNGLMGNHTETKPDVKTLPHYLKPLGYRVVLANKDHVKPAEVFPFERLDAWLPEDPADRRRYRRRGVDVTKIDAFLKAHRSEHPQQPLCLFICASGPHVTWERNHTYQPAELPILPNMVDTPKTRTALANYYQDISTTDERLGGVLAALDQHGFRDNTLVMATSDQGAEWPHSKWTCYDSGLHVPFVARWPGRIAAGSTCEALACFVDLLPTFLEVAGGPAADGIDGKSMLPLLTGEASVLRDYVYAAHVRDGEMNVFPQRSVRDTRWKFIFNLMPENKWTTHFTKVMDLPDSHGDVYRSWTLAAEQSPEVAELLKKIEFHSQFELYDTQSDPFELNNLAGDPVQAERVEQMRRLISEWIRQQGDADAIAAFDAIE